MFVDFGIDFVDAIGSMFACLYIFEKVIHYNPLIKQKWLSVLWCVLWAFLYAVKPYWIPFWLARPIVFVMLLLFIWGLTKIKLDMLLSAFMLSFGISYAFLCMASLLVGLLSFSFISAGYTTDSIIAFNQPVYFLFGIFIAFLQLFFSFLLFKIRRFRNGFPFLLKSYALIVALIAAGIVFVLISLLITLDQGYEQRYTLFSLIFGVIAVGTGVILWVIRGIKSFYKRKLKENSVELFEKELAEKEHEIQLLTEQNDALRVAIHKINHRLTALEYSASRIVKQADTYMEDSDMAATILEDINRLSKDFQGDVNMIKGEVFLPSTKIKMLDDLFRYFAKQCEDNKIDFSLKINGSIPYMVEHIISQSKLEIMIGDHFQNALIAVNMSDNSFRCILVMLGLAENCYELSIFDSGIPFETDTLDRIGKERITTHADTGGTGIGFMTTFETMKEYGASLVINEKEPSNNDFTKSVTIRFDSKKQYIIETYRPNDFSNQNDGYCIVNHMDTNKKSSLPVK